MLREIGLGLDGRRGRVLYCYFALAWRQSQIASDLGISDRAVRKHVAALRDRFPRLSQRRYHTAHGTAPGVFSLREDEAAFVSPN